jgi:hypothetical protein
MPYEIIHFREAEKIIKSKKMKKEVDTMLKYVDESLYERWYRGTLLKSCLEEMGWRDDDQLNILEGRRYSYKGFFKRIAVEANLTNYEWILDGLFRLQIGFDKGRFDLGLLLLNQFRSEKSPLGNNIELVKQEVESLYPTISMPVSIVLFDLGNPQCLDPEPNRRQAQNAVNGALMTVVPNEPNDSSAQEEIETPQPLKEVA